MQLYYYSSMFIHSKILPTENWLNVHMLPCPKRKEESHLDYSSYPNPTPEPSVEYRCVHNIMQGKVYIL